MTQTNEELRKKIHYELMGILHRAVVWFRENQSLNTDLVALEIMSLIPQPEQSKEPESNYVSLVNGSGTHCKECGKRL